MGSSPKPPKPTAAQNAFETEQRRALNDEVVEENRRRKALARGRLGAVSLLSGLDPSTGSIPAGGGSGSGGGSTIGGESSSLSATAPGTNKGTPRKVGNVVRGR
jgi:hypothetical protein